MPKENFMSKKPKRVEQIILGKMLRRIAPKIGATIQLEPEFGIVGRITFKSGRRSYFRYSTTDLNSMGASEIARDKDYSNYFIKLLGYPIVPGQKFYSPMWGKAIGSPQRNIDAAYKYARKIGMPVIVKPNSGSQGSGVALVHNKREFYKAVRAVFQKDPSVPLMMPSAVFPNVLMAPSAKSAFRSPKPMSVLVVRPFRLLSPRA
jgi:hypothetical protein